MPKSDIEPYVEGDKLDDGQGSIAYVRKCRFGSGDQKLRAICVSGPKRDQWFWPDRFGKPVLDWTDDGLKRRCVECSREFRSGIDACGLDHIKCRTCEGFEKTEVARMGQDASPSHGFGTRAWNMNRGHLRKTATDEAEDEIAAEARGK